MEQSVKLASSFIYPHLKPPGCIHWHFVFALCLMKLPPLLHVDLNVDLFIFPFLPNTILPKQDSLTFIISRKHLWAVFVSFKPIQLIWGHLIPVMFAWPTKLFNSFFSGQINSQAMYKFQKAEKCVLWKHTFLSFPQLNWLYFSYKSSFCYRLVCH